MVEVRSRAQESPQGSTRGIPWEMQDAVEMWARSKGRHARVVYLPALRTHAVEIELKPDDPRMRGWLEGRVSVKPKEMVYLHYQPLKPGSRTEHEPHFRPIPLEEVGVEGLLEILNRGDMTSGRGEFQTPEQVVEHIGRKNDALRDSIKRAARDNARQRGRDLYRHRHVPKTVVTRNIGE